MYSALGWIIFLLGASAFGQEIPAFLTPGEDTLQPEIREARNRKFNVRLPFAMWEAGPNGIQRFSLVDREPIPEMPFDRVDTVVIGELVNRGVFFSADGKGLYTEDTIAVSEVVKARQGAAIYPQSRLVILRPGGAGKMEDQRIIRHEIRGYVIPAPKQHYLLFLTEDRPLDAYFARKFWRIDKGLLEPSFPEDARSSWAGKTVASLFTAWKSGAWRN
ncbi:MAG TPA: hypothetical protein VFQ91_02025 [Bryobacteraceae bacterium]|nr:hypothetical protein [Bryobacteraceae bacterium]